jgi:hypothetical protein
MTKKVETSAVPKNDYVLLVEEGKFSFMCRVDSGGLVRVQYGFASKFKISGLPENRGWSSRKISGGKVSHNKMVRGNEDFQQAFLEALRAMGSRGVKPKLVEVIPDPFLQLAKNALARYEKETK